MSFLEDPSIDYQINKVKIEDKPFHDWYRFILSFPPHLAKHYLDKFNVQGSDLVLDPFSGTGTTLVESKLNGFVSIGIEANPIIKYITQTKLNWTGNTEKLIDHALDISNEVNSIFRCQGIDDKNLQSELKSISFLDLPSESKSILLANSISPLPLHKALTLLSKIKDTDKETKDYLLVAFLKTVISNLSNLRFGPEIGLGKIKHDASLLEPWLNNVRTIKDDLDGIQAKGITSESSVLLGDSRNAHQYLIPNSVKAVITSPPYPNEKDYSRTTRLENVMLGFINNKAELRQIKKTFVRSNTRSVYKDDDDHKYILHLKSITDIATQIEQRRIELNKTSGFEKMYSKVTLQYFGGMARHLANLRVSLTKGAKLAYVVGDQASYLRVMIKTGELLAEIAHGQGYRVIDLELFRKRFSTASKAELREEVLILEWNG
jgi:DNA modification methylase